MAFGKIKDEAFQRVTTVKDEPAKTEKKKKEKKAKVEEAPVPAPDTSMWSSGNGAERPQRFDASEAPAVKPVNENETAAPEAPAPETASGVREVGSAPKDTRPIIEMSNSFGVDEGEITGGMYSDSGRTVTMAMRLMSYLFYACAPLFFAAKIFELIGTDAEEMTTGFAVSTVIEGVIGAVVFIGAGILVVGLIKILQNLMALQKKKKKR